MRTSVYIGKGLIVLIFFLLALKTEAQETLILDKGKSYLNVSGTSSLHNWEMEAEDYTCSMMINKDEQKILVRKVDFSCRSNSIKSDKNLMDKKAWDALKVDQYKQIQFESAGANTFQISDQTLTGNVTGDLMLSGEKKRIVIPVSGEIDQLGNLHFQGEATLKMSDFGIKPPTVLMGTIKTGEDIMIEFSFSFKESSERISISEKRTDKSRDFSIDRIN